jgi:hypothetical protein
LRGWGRPDKDRFSNERAKRIEMADETVQRDNMKAHLSTYASIMNLLKWGTLGCAIVAAIVIWLIA